MGCYPSELKNAQSAGAASGHRSRAGVTPMIRAWANLVRYLRGVRDDCAALLAFVAGDRGAPPADRAL
jgi:hypothetical protein